MRIRSGQTLQITQQCDAVIRNIRIRHGGYMSYVFKTSRETSGLYKRKFDMTAFLYGHLV